MGELVDITKARRKIRTLDGVRFFGAPIGTPITSEMISAAMAKHGKVRTNNMIDRQKRNNVRDARQNVYQRAAVQRSEKREHEKEINAAKRAKDKANAEYRREQARAQANGVKGVKVVTPEAPVSGDMVRNKPSVQGAPAKQQAAKPDVAKPGERTTVLTDKQWDFAIFMTQQNTKLGPKEAQVIARLVGTLKGSPHPEDRTLGRELAESIKRRMNVR